MNNVTLGIQIAVLITGGILAGMGVGYLIDKYLVTYPLIMIIGVIGGVLLGAAGVYVVVNKQNSTKQ